jgi:parallel beta-helix repeat protein
LDVTSSAINNNSSEEGGGVAGDDSSTLTILNCTIESNIAQEKGGGIYSSFATIANSTISGNTVGKIDTPGYGGGIYDPSAAISFCDVINNTVGGNIARGGGVYGGSVIEYCTINNNVASGSMTSYGGGVHSGGKIVDCRIENNTASKGSGYGGGIYGVSEVISSIIKNNEASVNGGGINITYTEAFVNRCIIVNNMAFTGRGGGIFGPSWYRGIIANTNISGNSADLGGGIFCSMCTPKIINSTIVRNSASTSGGAIYSYNENTIISLANTILWENEANGIPNEIHLDFDAVLNASYSIIKGGWPGIGIVDTDPLFADVSSPDPLQWNLHLTPLSPAIDSGDDLAFTLAEALDIDGGPRFYDGDEDIIATIDIGSDEYVPCPADFNYDGDIDANDLAGYINNYETPGGIDLEQFTLAYGQMCIP